MDTVLGEIEAALTTVQQTLDALTSRGKHEAAYEIARAQYVASIRSSWPQNPGPLVQALEQTADDPRNGLTAEELARLRRAVEVLRRAVAQ
jgi:hypothetical protein